MKTRIAFLQAKDRQPSTCGEPLEITLSSRDLSWEGVLLEKGRSPYFYPKDIVTPYFYFALALEEDLYWEVQQAGNMQALKTVPGEIWLNPPWTPFSHTIKEPCFFTIFAVTEETMFRMGSISPEIQTQLQFLNDYNINDPILKNFIEMFSFEASNKGKNGLDFQRSLSQTFCSYFIKNYSNLSSLTVEKDAHKRLTPQLLSIVETYVKENLEEAITIEELAAEVNMSKFYFLREFKKETNHTPYQYLINLRIESAKTTLKQSEKSIAEVALELGFSDQSHFSKTFKRIVGASPGQFRKG
ncbi:MAG: AraC family transcriptional regulator [Spirochaetota bacterium]